VSRPRLFRFFAAIAAALLGFSGAGVVIAHASVHAHLATDHQAAVPFAVPTIEDGDHGHHHDHLSVGTAPTSRDGTRLDLPQCELEPAVARHLQPSVAGPSQGEPPSLLPRPGPEPRPASRPRAPPTA
jgi:hypothetical protein